MSATEERKDRSRSRSRINSASSASSRDSSESHSKNAYRQIRKQSSPAYLSVGYPSSPGYSTPSPIREAKRSQSVKYPSGHRRNTAALLTVPNTLDFENFRNRRFTLNHINDEDLRDLQVYRLRNFEVTPKGLVNRGDSYRARSSSSLNTPSGPIGENHVSRKERLSVSSAYSGAETSTSFSGDASASDTPRYKVLISGAPNVGKTSLANQFLTSEYMNAYDGDFPDDDESAKAVSVLLDGQEAELYFIDPDSKRGVTFYEEKGSEGSVDAHVIVYNVAERSSFDSAIDVLFELKQSEATKNRAIILVGNKSDLVRARVVTTEEGKAVAASYDCKFIETSAGLNHNVDELLVGILAQIRLKEKYNAKKSKNRGILRYKGRNQQQKRSLTSGYEKAFGVLARLLRRNSVSKSCGNLHVL